ncbi:hypothetical protein BVRB_9g212850 [Beta vulgaris subsp. vulgaris]|nr:hypothetical protein BVRB_9g212850 [Beta vulgaris subsp. vulgaris]
MVLLGSKLFSTFFFFFSLLACFLRLSLETKGEKS